MTTEPIILAHEISRAQFAAENNAQTLKTALRAHAALHTIRSLDDPRCRTCRDTSGRPAAYPCACDILLSVAFGVALQREALFTLRNAGRRLNNLKPEPTAGVPRLLRPYLRDPQTRDLAQSALKQLFPMEAL